MTLLRAEQVLEVLEDIEPYTAFCGEVQFIDGRYSIGGGTWTKFWHQDKSDLDSFEATNKRTASKQGQRYMMLLIELADDERPVDQQARERAERTVPPEMKGGELCRLAVMFCKNADFQAWLNTINPREEGLGDWNEARCKVWICAVCGVESRRELDHNQHAAQRFHTMIRRPFLEWNEGRE